MKDYFRQFYLLCLIFGFLFSLSAGAQPAGAGVEPVKLNGNVYIFKGTMANSAALIGEDGALLVDSGDKPEVAEKLQAAVASLTPKPIRFLINTHWHFDHVNGNEWMGSRGITIIGQAKMRERVATQPAMGGTSPVKPVGLPMITFSRDLTLQLDGEEVYLFHPSVGEAHTDGDTIVFFRKANVVHLADLFFNGLYPYIDVPAGGWIDGIIKAGQEVLPMINDQTILIPGHGPVTNKKRFEEYLAMLSDISAKVTALIKEGKSAEEVKKSKPTAAYDADWAKGFMNPDQFTQLVYAGLVKHLPK
jgi:cyclase